MPGEMENAVRAEKRDNCIAPCSIAGEERSTGIQRRDVLGFSLGARELAESSRRTVKQRLSDDERRESRRRPLRTPSDEKERRGGLSPHGVPLDDILPRGAIPKGREGQTR